MEIVENKIVQSVLILQAVKNAVDFSMSMGVTASVELKTVKSVAKKVALNAMKAFL